MERDKVYGQNLNAERKVARVGFNERVSEVDERMIKEEAAIRLQKSLHQLAFSVRVDWNTWDECVLTIFKQAETLDLDTVI